MVRTIDIGGQEVRLRATAAVPRLYRIKFGRDILRDVLTLQKAWKAALEENGGMDSEEDGQRESMSVLLIDRLDLSILENVAYIMARHADPEGVPADPEQWLERFDTMGFYRAMGEIVGFWAESMKGAVNPKKP